MSQMRPSELAYLYAENSSIPGVGKRHAAALEKFLGRRNIDLLFHLPHSVVEWQTVLSLSTSPLQKNIAIPLNVISHHIPPRASRTPTKVMCQDEHGETVALVFFRASRYILDKLEVGKQLFIFGKITQYQNQFQIQHPAKIITPEEFPSSKTIEPVYPLSVGITNTLMQKCIDHLLCALPEMAEWIPEQRLKEQHWPSFCHALHKVHHPRSRKDLSPHAPHRQRLAYDEILAHQLALKLGYAKIAEETQTQPIQIDANFNAEFQSHLPFTLTNAQRKAIDEILKDICSTKPMQRLLQGDVGSGKTVVAFACMIACAKVGYQACIMAPTETLATQHYKKLCEMAEILSIKVALLVGGQSPKVQREIRSDIENGIVQIAVGTHTLFQEKSIFSKLRLIVIDEQQRFGVHQRIALAEKGYKTDILILTATPIPRTLMMVHYGNLDVSLLKEKPPGRQPIQTSVISADRLSEIENALQEQIAQQARVFWVCPLVEVSEKSDLTPTALRYERMVELFGESKVAVVHGKIKANERTSIIESFRKGQTQILVATTVIEVGIDVPEADVMIIEHAERFGLSQLHQLRGRVGRSGKKGYCILLYHGPIHNIAKERLQTLKNSQDGFFIAEKDLQLRGAGEILGTKQSGDGAFRLADFSCHKDALYLANEDAGTIVYSKQQQYLLYLFGYEQVAKLIKSG